MSSTTKTINEKTQEMFKLLLPHRSTPIMQRINALSVERTTKKLTDFLGNGAPEEERHKLLDEITDIVTKGEFDRLPAAPSGQAAPTSPAVAVAKPAPAAATPTAPAPKPRAVEVPPVEATPVEAPEDDDMAVALAAMTKALAARRTPAAPSTPSLTEAAVRSIVHQEVVYLVNKEVAEIFAKLAEVLKERAT